MEREKAIVFWSGGKDAALALYKLFESGQYEIVGLVTTLNALYNRSSMHGVREEMMDLQAERIGLPLYKMWMNEGTNQEYEDAFVATIKSFVDQGVKRVVFGDIFLEDLKIYRNQLLKKAGAEGVYPLWKEDTGKLLKEGIDLGMKTIVCTASNRYFDDKVVGQILSTELLEKYSNVDPCGENGEFHTFVIDAPYFSSAIVYRLEEKVFKEISLDENNTVGFWYCDIST